MPSPGDVQATKALRRALTKKMIDVTYADIRVTHGVAYIRGVIKPMRGGPELAKVRSECEHVGQILRQQGHAKEIVVDAIIRDT